MKCRNKDNEQVYKVKIWKQEMFANAMTFENQRRQLIDKLLYSLHASFEF